MSKDKISQFLKSSNDSKEISNLEHSPYFHPTMWFLNIITFHFLIAFGDLIWQCSKERSKFWWSWSFIIKKICLVLKHYDFPKWLFKGSHLVQKKKKWKFDFFSKKKKKGKKKREISFQKKKKNILFQNLVLLNYVLTWSSMKEVRRQPCKGPVPFTQSTLENKVKTMWQNCLDAC